MICAIGVVYLQQTGFLREDFHAFLSFVCTLSRPTDYCTLLRQLVALAPPVMQSGIEKRQ
jgi:hypothetical protein